MRRNQRIAVAIIILLMASGWYFLPKRLRVVTGFAAKSMCSCVFVADRTPESNRQRDLNFSLIKYARAWVDREERAAYATIFGLARRKAIYREGLGCRLVFGGEDGGARERFAVPEAPAGADTLYWPAGERVPDSTLEGVDYERLNATLARYFDRPGERRLNTNGAVVVYRGQLVAERYAEGFGPQTPQLGWSMAKTLTGALVGLLVDEGVLELDAPAPVPAWQGDERRAITLSHLMRMSSGLAWREEYGGISDATAMLYLERDKAGYAIERPLAAEPGSTWVYASGTSNILQYILRRQFDSDGAYWRFPYEQLLHRIGMRNTVFETDATGLFVGSSYVYASARDWARLGLLYLRRGRWQGERVLSEDWIEFSITPTPESGYEYAGQLWHNRPGVYPSAPRDMFVFQGFHGQRVFVLPSHDLVVVRLGVSEDGTFDFDAFLREVMACLGD